MHYYTTLFDSFYLSRGLAMYQSLRKCTPDFHLYVFAFDDVTYDVIKKMKLENLTVISLSEFETDELTEVKKGRSKAEYCWTCTPSVISYVLEKYNVPDCTYIDADLYFFTDPAVLISELYANTKNVLVTEHRYSFLPRLYAHKKSGRFCVQFMTFTNEENSLAVLDRWRRQCIGWCYARHEDGKFGDQKYLDEWPGIYNNVHILEHQGGGLAPWNLQNYSVVRDGDETYVKDSRTGIVYPLVFYHFQYVKFLGDGTFDIGWYQIRKKTRRIIYQPYLRHLEDIEKELLKMDLGYERYFYDPGIMYKGTIFKAFLKKVLHYNIVQKEI